MKQSHKTLLLWVLLIVMFLAIWQVLQPGDRKQQVSFSEFVTWVHSGQVSDVHVKDHEYQFTHVVDGHVRSYPLPDYLPVILAPFGGCEPQDCTGEFGVIPPLLGAFLHGLAEEQRSSSAGKAGDVEVRSITETREIKT